MLFTDVILMKNSTVNILLTNWSCDSHGHIMHMKNSCMKN